MRHCSISKFGIFLYYEFHVDKYDLSLLNQAVKKSKNQHSVTSRSPDTDADYSIQELLKGKNTEYAGSCFKFNRKKQN